MKDLTDFSAKKVQLLLLRIYVLIFHQYKSVFISGRHRKISSIYVTQKYQSTLKIIRENCSYLTLFNGGSSQEDIGRIIIQYTNDPRKCAKIIDKYLRDCGFVALDCVGMHHYCFHQLQSYCIMYNYYSGLVHETLRLVNSQQYELGYSHIIYLMSYYI